jgi:plasmid stabilization system protein ParE
MKAAALALVAACGGLGRARQVPAKAPPHVVTGTEHVLALLPEGAQLIVEIDLARLRKNPVVGEVATKALAQLGAEAKLPGLPLVAQGSPLAGADTVVMAAYGVGTAQAATLTILQTTENLADATRIAPDLVAIGPEDWTGQLASRAAIDAQHALAPSEDLLRLRDHAMPPGATGAVFRVTARLPFDARIAFARQTGLDAAPAQLSIWADIADDLAVVVDADAADPGDKAGHEAAKRLAGTIRSTLATLADDPSVRALGVPGSLTDAHLVTQGTWVRAIVAVGPHHLQRAVERARAMLGPSS